MSRILRPNRAHRWWSLALVASFVAVVLMAAARSRPAPLAGSRLQLWYDKPAGAFEDALPLGNGRIGATVFDGPASDRIMLNEATLWTGGPIDPTVNPEAVTFLPKVRDALFKGDYKLANQLTRKLQGRFLESYAPLGVSSST